MKVASEEIYSVWSVCLLLELGCGLLSNGARDDINDYLTASGQELFWSAPNVGERPK